MINYKERLNAEAQRLNAEAQKDTALVAISKLTYDVPDRLLKIPGNLATLRGMFEENIGMVDRVLSREPDTPRAQRQRFDNLIRKGDVWRVLGDVPKARQAYEESRDLMDRLAVPQPSNGEWQLGRLISRAKIGEALAAQGEYNGALAAYLEALGIGVRLSNQGSDDGPEDLVPSVIRLFEQEQKNTKLVRNVVAILKDWGDLNIAMGRPPGWAQIHYTNALKGAKRLIVLEPDKTATQSEVQDLLVKICDLSISLSQIDTAAQYCREAFDTAARLAKRDPENSQWQSDVAVSHDKMGDMRAGHDKFKEAYDHYLKAFEIRQNLARQDLNNAEWMRALATSYEKVGGLFFDSRQEEQALKMYRQAFETREYLAKRDPSNTDLQRDVAAIRMKLGDVFLRADDQAKAIEEYRQALAIRQSLPAQVLGNNKWDRELATNHEMIGKALFDLGNLNEALQSFHHARKALNNVEAGTRLDILNLSYPTPLARVHGYIALTELYKRHAKEAIAAATTGVALDSGQTWIKRLLAHGYLFDSQFKKAKAIYLENKDIKDFAEMVLSDFEDFRKDGLTHPDMDKIEDCSPHRRIALCKEGVCDSSCNYFPSSRMSRKTERPLRVATRP